MCGAGKNLSGVANCESLNPMGQLVICELTHGSLSDATVHDRELLKMLLLDDRCELPLLVPLVVLLPRSYKKMSKCYTRPMFPRLQCGPMVRFLLLASIVFFFLSELAAYSQSSPASVTDLDGHAVDPFHPGPGKIVVLLFVRTDCPISNRYAPTVQAMSAHYGTHATFYLVYPIKTESADQIRKHAKEYGYHLPILRDPDYALVKRALVQVTPEAAVFSSEGRLLYHGRIDDWYVDFGRARASPTTHDLSAALDAAVADKPVPTAGAPAIGCFLPGLP